MMWRQTKQLNFNMKAYVGNGTLLYSDLPESLGSDIDYVFDIQGCGMTNFNLDHISKKTRDRLKEANQPYAKNSPSKISQLS